MSDSANGHLSDDSKEIRLALINAEAEIKKQKIATKSAVLVATVSAIGGLAIALAPKIIKEDPPALPAVIPVADAASGCEASVLQGEPMLASSIDPFPKAVGACEAKALKAVVAIGGVVSNGYVGDGVAGTVDGNTFMIICAGEQFSVTVAGSDAEKVELFLGRVRNFMSK